MTPIAKNLQISCAFAPTSDTQLLTPITVSQGTTVLQAVEQTGWFTIYPKLQDYEVGIFAKKVTWNTLVKNGDRIEIYRPLTIDPITRRSLKRDLKKKQRLG